jgi:RNA polymerase sigma-70 factor, ECF subfamily
MSPDNATRTLVADLFRRESARLIAMLARRIGAARIDLVEDAVQDALVSAMRSWSIQRLPANPSAWLYTAARNALTDRLRRARFELPESGQLELASSATQADARFASEEALDDDLLSLIAYCCHPAISQAAQLALTLRLACGLGVGEIAGALLTTPESVAQRIVRAKRELRALDVTFDLSARELIDERLPGILNTIYLLFDAGYLSTQHEQWLRPLLCADALRLSRMLAMHPATDEPETQALAALLHFTAARLPARVGEAGEPVRLAKQDRSKWDPALIEAGFRHFDASIRGEALTRYHIEAVIAATHAAAPSMEATDWDAILGHYDQLCRLYASPVAALNRIIALRYARGAQAAFDEITGSQGLESLQDSLLYHATMAELHEALGEHRQAAEEFDAAARLAGSNTLAQLFRDRYQASRARIDEAS